MSNELRTLVIDIGSHMSKVGFAGDEAPRCTFRSLVGFPKYPLAFPALSCQIKDVYIGNEASDKAAILYLRSLINDDGVLTNEVDMDKLYHHIFYSELRVDPMEYAVLFTDHHGRQDARKAQREKLAQVMFETFSIQSVFIEYPTTLAAFTSGKFTALVVDCGHSDVEASVMIHGYRIPNFCNHLGFGGRFLTEYLLRILGENAVLFNTRSNLDMARDIKEKLCYTAENFYAEEDSHKPNDEYTRLNGDTITVGDQRFRCPEALFQPWLAKHEACDGIHKIINNLIQKCDADVQRELWGNIVLSGGSSLFKGFPERIEKECSLCAPLTMKVKVVAAPERGNAAWIGGSMFASLATFPSMAFTRYEYDEAGVFYMHRKMLL